MKKKRGTFVMNLFLMFLMLFSGMSLAQQMPAGFCGDLSEADCEVLTASQAAMMQVNSGRSDFTININITDIPDAPMESLAFDLTGDVAYAVDPALMDMMNAMQTDPTAMFADPEAFAQLFSDLFAGISTDLNLTLTLPDELLSAMASGETPIPETLSLSARLVDGFGYINLDEIATAVPDAGLPEGWVGIDLAGLMDRAMEQGDFDAAAGMNPEIMSDYMRSFQDPEIYGEFVTIERGEDTVVDGQPAAVFNSTFDYAAFFRSDIFQNMMRAQMEAIGEMSGEELSEEDMAEMDEMMGMMGPMFEDITLNMSQTIGLEDNYIHAFEMHMAWDMTNFMNQVDPSAEGAAPNFTFDMVIQNSDFNSAPEIVAPEDPTIFPLDAMMPQASS